MDIQEAINKAIKQISNNEKIIELTPISLTDFTYIQKYIFKECPLLFNVLSYSSSYKNKVGTITCTYRYGKDEYKSLLSFVTNKVDKVVKSMPNDLTELGKIKYVHDYIIKYYRYRFFYCPQATLILVQLITGYGSCLSFSQFTKMIFDRIGIESYVVAGSHKYEKNNMHAWNVIKINRKYRYFDVTADMGDSTENKICYKCLRLDVEEFLYPYKINKEYNFLPFYDLFY